MPRNKQFIHDIHFQLISFIFGSIVFFSSFSSFNVLDDKDQKKSQKVLAELENIDDECDQNDIAFVKIDDDKEAEEWGIDEVPTIVNIATYKLT